MRRTVHPMQCQIACKQKTVRIQVKTPQNTAPKAIAPMRSFSNPRRNPGGDPDDSPAHSTLPLMTDVPSHCEPFPTELLALRAMIAVAHAQGSTGALERKKITRQIEKQQLSQEQIPREIQFIWNPEQLAAACRGAEQKAKVYAAAAFLVGERKVATMGFHAFLHNLAVSLNLSQQEVRSIHRTLWAGEHKAGNDTTSNCALHRVLA